LPKASVEPFPGQSTNVYQDAVYVFYRDMNLLIVPAHPKTLGFMQGLPTKGLVSIRRLSLRASTADSDLILKNTWTRTINVAKPWSLLVDFLRCNFDLPNLSLLVDLTALGRWCLSGGPKEEECRRTGYQYYRFITSMLCRLKGLKAVEFEVVWAEDLIPWMKREILGDRFRGEIVDPDSNKRDSSSVPYWHQSDDRVEDSNYNPE